MLSYQHAYHAGNFADVHKHAVLCLLLEALRAKEKPYFVLDAFAGRGGYDLASQESAKTGEYHHGVEKVWPESDAPPSLSSYMAAVRQYNEDDGLKRYPGSPWLIRQLLRQQDRMALCELHPAEFDLLRSTIRSSRQVALHMRDGLDAMKGLLPPKERRGLLLIDPSYEVKSEYAGVAEAIVHAYRHWREGVYAVWYPLLAADNHDKLLNGLKHSGIRKILDSRLIVDSDRAPGMFGSGMVIINPPWKLEEQLKEVLPWLAGRLGRKGKGEFSVRWLVAE